MAKVEPLGIKRLESVHYYVHDLERSRRFYTELLDFQEIGGSNEELTKAGRQKSLAFMTGNAVVVCIEPRGEGGRASRWFRKHPDGVGTLNFEVEDVEKAFRLLEKGVAPPSGTSRGSRTTAGARSHSSRSRRPSAMRPSASSSATGTRPCFPVSRHTTSRREA